MNPRKLLLRTNALFLLIAASGGLRSDLLGAFRGEGMLGGVLAQVPHAAIGFVEAHGLALLFGVLLWLAQPARLWHGTGAAVHLLLGTCNVAFWPLFVATDALWLGYVTTSLHFTFFVLHSLAAAWYRIDRAGWKDAGSGLVWGWHAPRGGRGP